MLEFALDSGKNYDFFVLLSGQDYPIKKMRECIDFLSEHCNEPFMDFVPLDSTDYKNFEARNSVFFPRFLIGRGKAIALLRKVYIDLCTAMKLYRKPLFDQFFFGSSWWAMPGLYAEEIVQYCKDNPGINEFFRHSLCPDECMFQTIAKTLFPNSNFNHKLTYTDWSENQSGPKTLQITDIDSLLKQNDNYFFARKFDAANSMDVLDYIDEAIEKLNG